MSPRHTPHPCSRNLIKTFPKLQRTGEGQLSQKQFSEHYGVVEESGTRLLCCTPILKPAMKLLSLSLGLLVTILFGCAPVSEKQDTYFLSAEAIEKGSPRVCAGVEEDWSACKRSVEVAERWRGRLEFKSFTAPTERSGEQLWRPFGMSDDGTCLSASYMSFNGSAPIPEQVTAFTINICRYDAADLSRVTFSCPILRKQVPWEYSPPRHVACATVNWPDGPVIHLTNRDPVPSRTLELAMTNAFEPPLHIETTGRKAD